MFKVLFAIAILVPFVWMASFWWDAHKRGWAWVTKDSLALYVDCAKTLLTASGIAVAVLVSALGGKLSPPMWIVQRAFVGLFLCVVFSPLTILALTRGYDRASSRHQEREPKSRFPDQGELSRFELLLILLSAYFALEGFVLGFLYLARIPFALVASAGASVDSLTVAG